MLLISTSCEKNNAPTCTITEPNNGDDIGIGELVTITVDADDTDGSVSEVRFYLNGKSVGSSTTFPYKYEWNTVGYESGNYTIKATAKDNSGESTTDEVNVSLVSLEIPNIHFNVSLNITLPLYAPLQNPLGGIVFYNSGAGSKGLAILRISNDEFVIYDRHCPYLVKDGCVVEEDENKIGGLIDLGCCNSKFNMINGGYPSEEGPAVNRLKSYNYTFNGTVLNIFN
jgi:Rieske Fe-S protein